MIYKTTPAPETLSNNLPPFTPSAFSVPVPFICLLLLECTRHTGDWGLLLKLFFLTQMFFLQICLGIMSSLSSSLCSNVTFWVRPTYHCPLYIPPLSTVSSPYLHTLSIFPTLLYLLLSLLHITFKYIVYLSCLWVAVSPFTEVPLP